MLGTPTKRGHTHTHTHTHIHTQYHTYTHAHACTHTTTQTVYRHTAHRSTHKQSLTQTRTRAYGHVHIHILACTRRPCCGASRQACGFTALRDPKTRSSAPGACLLPDRACFMHSLFLMPSGITLICVHHSRSSSLSCVDPSCQMA